MEQGASTDPGSWRCRGGRWCVHLATLSYAAIHFVVLDSVVLLLSPSLVYEDEFSLLFSLYVLNHVTNNVCARCANVCPVEWTGDVSACFDPAQVLWNAAGTELSFQIKHTSASQTCAVAAGAVLVVAIPIANSNAISMHENVDLRYCSSQNLLNMRACCATGETCAELLPKHAWI